MSKKRKGKIKLPCDRYGTPIHVGDVLMWDGGDTMRVEELVYLGEEFIDSLGFRWIAADGDDNTSDNLSECKIVWKAEER